MLTFFKVICLALIVALLYFLLTQDTFKKTKRYQSTKTNQVYQGQSLKKSTAAFMNITKHFWNNDSSMNLF